MRAHAQTFAYFTEREASVVTLVASVKQRVDIRQMLDKFRHRYIRVMKLDCRVLSRGKVKRNYFGRLLRPPSI